jgi:hypothetical protein
LCVEGGCGKAHEEPGQKVSSRGHLALDECSPAEVVFVPYFLLISQ